ncbi:GIY-YIG nuclease family protein [Streptomyces sp. NPDC050564]|uniref:GIY-YIG nuclease family protein n=1 Tax=Streptomyces sp. NPDC050564 TaxID=3365631 RepID=UPI00378BCA77
MTEECVYVIGTPGVNVVKIGTTNQPDRRLRDIQRMSPLPLAILWSHPGGRELEMNLHKHFKNLRSHGEWFEFHADPVRLVRWAVEDQPWLRPKVSLKRLAGIPAAARTPILGAHSPSSLPLYKTLAEHIRQQIMNGSIAVGSKTPALHTYAEQFNCSYETVKRACDDLADVGALQHSSGGYYVPKEPRPVLPHDWPRRFSFPA